MLRMNRRQLSFIIILNAVISLVIAMAVVWIVEARRPDPEALAAIYTPVTAPSAPIAATFTPAAAGGEQPAAEAAPDAAADPGANAGAAPTAAADAAAATTADPAATTAADAEGTEYVIQVGDSLSGVADRFGVPVAAIVEANNMDNPDFVFVGQRLIIPSADAVLPAATPTPIAASVNTGIRLTAVAGAGDVAAETVNIANDSDLAVNLQGWRLERTGGPAYTFGNILLFPGSGLTLHSGAGTDSSVDVYWNQSAAVWSSGATAQLINPQGTEVARLAVP
jgi:competence protein ComEC